MKMTYERLKLVNELKKGTKTWTALRLAYYGEERAKSIASTSFQNQLNRMMEGKVIEKTFGGYQLTEEFRKTLYWDCNACGEVDNLKDYCDSGRLPKLPCGHVTHENGGPVDYGPECRL